MTKIALKQLGPNQTVLSIGPVEVFFSYETPVAAFVPGEGYIRTETKWSVTTSRHINKWCPDFATVVPQERIDRILERRVA